MKNTTILYTILLASLLGLMPACAPTNLNPAPTPWPPEYFPTVVVETAQAAIATNQALTLSVTPTETIVPTETLTPSDTLTPIPSDTNTPSPSASGAQIQIYAPGPMSKVISPISLRMQIVSGGSELVQIDLQGEDGRLLARKLERVPSWPGGFNVSLKIPFETSAAAEVGRITISTKDDEGRVQSLLTMRVLLLSVGENEINPSGIVKERVVFYQPPKKDAAVSGGELEVEGRYLPFNDQPVILELVGAAGKPFGLRVLDFTGTDVQTFSTTIPYKVFEPTMVRLILRQDDEGMDGLVYLYSQEILLTP